MQRFELGLPFKIQKQNEMNRHKTLEKMFKRASQIWDILRKEREKEKQVVGIKVRKCLINFLDHKNFD